MTNLTPDPVVIEASPQDKIGDVLVDKGIVTWKLRWYDGTPYGAAFVLPPRSELQLRPVVGQLDGPDGAAIIGDRVGDSVARSIRAIAGVNDFPPEVDDLAQLVADGPKSVPVRLNAALLVTLSASPQRVGLVALYGPDSDGFFEPVFRLYDDEPMYQIVPQGILYRFGRWLDEHLG